MEEIPSSFEGWQTFRDTLAAFSKAFGSYHRLGRFREVCIGQNANIPPAWKYVFYNLFQFICPKFTEHRWEYLYETLHWIMTRQKPLTCLSLDDVASESGQQSSASPNISDTLTPTEVQLLQCLSNKEGSSAAVFWATAGLTQVLADWGHWFSQAIHHCPCCHSDPDEEEKKKKNKKKVKAKAKAPVGGRDLVEPALCASKPCDGPCPMIGRTGVLLASGLPDIALQRLRDLVIPPSVTRSLDALDKETASSLLQQFELAKGRLSFRTKQNFSYWGTLPWSMLMIMRPFIEGFKSEHDAARL